ncbi:helix-turn-helix transcriptional regulator [Oceanobacillus longus]|uniref:Helix-turn-helix transcriptional regulator n=1 Tax=Oceanobacillus longus TaxID=930120 RepID=A0ABV8GZ79_9BACI
MKKDKKEELIEEGHKKREALLVAIQNGDSHAVNAIRESMKPFYPIMAEIFNRVSDNKVRSFKNILFSGNTLYSYFAEKGGLPASLSHYMTGKYSILIEHATTIDQLEEIQENMLKDYADVNLRIFSNEDLSVVDRVVNYININFMEDITIDDIAKKNHVHPNHLMRAFKKEKGMTISQFRRKRRILEAKDLLIHSSLSITDIAVTIGFDTPQYFSKIFKVEEGITPKDFRKEKRK